MARKRKYPEVVGYWVYTIQVPSINKYYVGVSKTKCHKRWIKSLYKGKSLEPYLNEWDSMIKTVLIDGLTKEEAYQYEDNIIQALSMNDLCINKHRSGLIAVSDKNAYNRELKKTNTEYHEQCKQLCKQWQKDNREKRNEYNKQRYANDAEYREKIKQRVKQSKLKKKLEKQQQNSLPLM